MEKDNTRPVYIIGHKNPDTDSICSALAYAYLKNTLEGGGYIAARAGQLNQETQYVLNYFQAEAPVYVADVMTQVKDIEIRKTEGVQSNLSLKQAWNLMRRIGAVTLPITKDQKIEGLITIGDIATSYMDVLDSKILAQAKEKGIPVMRLEKAALDRLAQGQAHQGVAAYVSPYAYSELEDIFALAEARGEDPLILILDNLEDPHNLGAIMRSAECAGAHGIIIPKRRACGLTEVVAKASAGAIEYMPCVKVTNIAQTIDELKARGLWIAACDMGGQNYYEAELTGKLAVVIGSEGFGISKLVREKCDFVVSMPMVGKITSLNASNAAAVIMYEIRKQRDGQ